MTDRAFKVGIALLLTLYAVMLIIMVFNRIADADEGVYANAARMINEGMVVYEDFFYTQFPMMVTLFAPLADGGWDSFFSLRLISAAFGFLGALVFFVIALKITRDKFATLLLTALYVFSGMYLTWNATFKPLPFTHFFTLSSFLCWMIYREKDNLTYLILGGLMISAAFNIRSIFIILVPLYLISFVVLARSSRIRSGIIFLLSLIPLSLPTFLTFLRATDGFISGNLFFQLQRDNPEFTYILLSKLSTIFRALIDPQLIIIFVLLILSVRFLILSGRIKTWKDIAANPSGFALANFIMIFSVYLLPNPMSRQYFHQSLPFAMIVGAFYIVHLLNKEKITFGKRRFNWLIASVAAVYIASLVPYGVIFLGGIRDHDKRYKINEIKSVTSEMLSVSDRSDTVLSEWPGYTFITEQTPLPYTEIIGGEYKLPLTHTEYMKHSLADWEYLEDMVLAGTPELIVTLNEPPDQYAAALGQSYKKTFQSDVVRVYKRQ